MLMSGQVGMINGQLAELDFGQGDDILHLLFHYQKSEEDETHVYGHYSVLVATSKVIPCDRQNGFYLPPTVFG